MRQYLFLKTGKYHYKIKFSDILYLQAEKKLVHVVTQTKDYVVLNSLREIEPQLPPEVFCKVHRSYLISLDHADKFDNEYVYINEKKIPISDRYRMLLKQDIHILTGHEDPLRLSNGDVDKLLGEI